LIGTAQSVSNLLTNSAPKSGLVILVFGCPGDFTNLRLTLSRHAFGIRQRSLETAARILSRLESVGVLTSSALGSDKIGG
jgi:hypothetical protein